MNPDPSNRSTDKYYASQRATTKPVAFTGFGSSAQPISHPQSTHQLMMRTDADVRPVGEALIGRLQARNTNLTVDVVGADVASLERQLRTYLDLAVARERITREQFRDILFSKAPPPPPPPEPELVPLGKEEEPIDDMEAFVGIDSGAPKGDIGVSVVNAPAAEKIMASMVEGGLEMTPVVEDDDVDDMDDEDDPEPEEDPEANALMAAEEKDFGDDFEDVEGFDAEDEKQVAIAAANRRKQDAQDAKSEDEDDPFPE